MLIALPVHRAGPAWAGSRRQGFFGRYTKVNRCLTEGRKAFLARVAGIEAGGECERLAPLLSKLVDGEATAEDLTAVRPHVRTCLSCRAALREYRAARATAAALVPAAVFAAHARPPLFEAPARLLEAVAGWTQKAHAAAEMASAQKVAAVAASTAVLAGGGVATVKQVERPAREPERTARASAEARLPAAMVPAPQHTPSILPEPVRVASPAELRQRREAQRVRAVERRTPPAQQEFEPGWAAAEPTSTTVTATSSSTSTSTTSTESAPSGGGGAEEFAP